MTMSNEKRVRSGESRACVGSITQRYCAYAVTHLNTTAMGDN